MPKISFVMPQKNRGGRIHKSIRSIIDQTENDWELIIVDDHSDQGDQTERVINEFNDKRIVYAKMPHKWPSGIPNARNFGNMFATASIIAVTDSDDINKARRAEITLEYFNKEKCDVFFGNYEIYKEKSNELIEPKYKIDKFKAEMMNERNYISHASSAYKREIAYMFPYNSFFGKGEDYDLFMRLLTANKKFSYSKEVVFRYVVHGGNISGGGSIEAVDNLIKLNNHIIEYNRDDLLKDFINDVYN